MTGAGCSPAPRVPGLGEIGSQRPAPQRQCVLFVHATEPCVADGNPSVRYLANLEDLARDDERLAQPHLPVQHDPVAHVDDAVSADAVAHALLNRERDESSGIHRIAEDRRIDSAQSDEPNLVGSHDRHLLRLVLVSHVGFDPLLFGSCAHRLSRWAK